MSFFSAQVRQAPELRRDGATRQRANAAAPRSALAFVRRNPLLAAFIAGALVVRLVFWFYTQRVWEDALITTTPARNAWMGNGLTHHVSEPRVHSFTSPISVLIPLVGEAISQGVLVLRLTSLLGTVAALVYASRIADLLELHVAPRVFLLGFLAFEQTHIFFGITGMETQIATAILLANAFYLLRRDWTKVGLLCGLALLARPEFGLWIAVAGLVVLFRAPRALPRFIGAFLLVAGPWIVFTTLYYGSPVPHTIVAKGLYGSGWPSWADTVDYLGSWWTVIAPFRAWSFTVDTPVPPLLLQLVALTVFALAVTGLWSARRERPLLATLGAFLALFFVYRTLAHLAAYFMWYMPPVTAFVAVLTAVGLNRLRRVSGVASAVVAGLLVVAFAAHMPFTFPLEKRVQRDIEVAVRTETGKYLDTVMDQDDTVVLEPLGFIAFEAFNKTTYDFPGLSSKVAAAAVSKLPPRRRDVMGLTDAIRPDYAVLRQGEWNFVREHYPETAGMYEELRWFRAREDLDLTQWGLEYFTIDHAFVVLRRVDA